MTERKGYIVAVDGPAGSGKSSLCAKACQVLGWTYVNTGAIYRAIGVLMERAGITATDTEGLCSLCDAFATKFRWNANAGQLFYDGEDLSPLLKNEIAGKNASAIAKIPLLREKLLPVQRALALAAPQGALIDGRDIGTVVFPQADLKVFMTASLEMRARRRLAEVKGKASLEEIMEDMRLRDLQDSGRGVAPLIQAPDAIVFDTSRLSFDESVEGLIHIIRSHLALH